MQANPNTIRLIRQITADGSLSEGEVWALGKYLNQNVEARESWPGNLLFTILRVVFEDGQLDPQELEALSYYLRGIELQCSMAGEETPDSDAVEPDSRKFETMECEISPIAFSADIAEDFPNDKVAHVDLQKQECDCSDWTYRRKFFPEGSPGRVCRHMVLALQMPRSEEGAELLLHPSMSRLLALHADLGRGFDAVANWQRVSADGVEFVVSWGDQGFVHVYADNGLGGTERYSFNSDTFRWAFGQSPPNRLLIQHYLRNSLKNSA